MGVTYCIEARCHGSQEKMKISKYFVIFIASFCVECLENEIVKESHEEDARVFPLLPPYYGVDYAANFNKLKSPGDAAYFVVRDSMVVSSEHPEIIHLGNERGSNFIKIFYGNSVYHVSDTFS